MSFVRRALGIIPCISKPKKKSDPKKEDALGKVDSVRQNRFDRDMYDLDDFDAVRGTRLSTGAYYLDSSNVVVQDFVNVPLDD